MPHMRTRGGTQLQRPPAARPPPAATPPLPTWVTSRGTGLVWHWRMTDMVTGAMSSIVVTLSSQAEMKAVTSLHRSARGTAARGAGMRSVNRWAAPAAGRQPARPQPRGDPTSRQRAAAGATHMSSRLSRTILPRLSLTHQAAISSNMPAWAHTRGGRQASPRSSGSCQHRTGGVQAQARRRATGRAAGGRRAPLHTVDKGDFACQCLRTWSQHTCVLQAPHNDHHAKEQACGGQARGGE